jgi:glucose-1-phosphate thymidylyltransferase
VSTGCSILPSVVIPDLLAFAKIKPDNVGGIFEELLRLQRPVQCFSFTDPWYDIGSFESYIDATRNIVGDQEIVAAESSVIDSKRIGSLVVGANSHIVQSEMENTVVFERCKIEDCVLRDCVIDDECVLKGVDLTGKMLRAGTMLVRA